VRARVDEQKCQGHTLCAMAAPQVFSLREDDGHSYVVNEQVAPEDEADVRNAAASCPEQAITIID
jgi:ferredoxin